MVAEKTYTDFRLTDIGRRLKYVVELTSIVVIYVALAKLSLGLASIHPSVTQIWPPTGFALGVVLLLGYQISFAIFLGAFIVNVTTAGSISTSLAIATGNALESLIGAYLINRWSDGCSTFDTPGGVIRFALICFIPSTMISATFGVGSLSLEGYAEWSDFRSIWTTWWMGDLAGALVITPAIVLWGTDPPRWLERRELIQSCLIYVATIAVGLVALLLSIVQSMANQVARQTNSLEDFYAGFTSRLCAFAETHDLLVKGDWHGADIRDLVRTQLAPFHNLGDNSVLIDGSELKLNPKAAEHIGLAVHELGTNAVKHGALSTPKGVVKIRWEQEKSGQPKALLRIIWKEIGGPPVEQPQRQGFGEVVLTKLVPVSLQGTASLEFEPEGVKWVLVAPSSSLLA